MRAAPIALTPDELSRLASALRGRDLTWLDGGGEGALGARSHLAWGPSELRVARLSDADPFAVFGGLEAPAMGVGDPRALRTTLVFHYDAAWAAPARFGIRASPRIARAPGATVAWSRTYEAALVYDHAEGQAYLGASSDAALLRAQADVEAARSSLRPAPSIRVTDVTSEPAALHEARIGRALEAIGTGALYQVNLARPWHARFQGEPMALALSMRRASPVPLGAYLEGPDEMTLLARTMERFLLIEPRSATGRRRIESRPIKGTIDVRPDAEAALLSSPKERAEHAMIVDLVRNDLGRIAAPGTVRTPALFSVEPYARLSHLVSVIEAELEDEVRLGDVLLATFPPASITGAPKIAAMEHIEALEDTPRGAYTGALGMIARDGTLSLAVAIRTAALKETSPGTGTLTYFAGGGIVEASDPGAEVKETELKARVLFDAIDGLSG